MAPMRSAIALAQLTALSAQQETVLREMAVRREPASLVFPPLRKTGEIQKSLPPGHALLVFFNTNRSLYAFLLNNEKYTYWRLGAPAGLDRQIKVLLRELGQYQGNHELGLKDLADNGWKQTAGEILDAICKGTIFRGPPADFSQKFDELIVVPDGELWYLPFEVLQVNANGQSRPLISRVRVRYAPTAALATSTGRSRSPAGNTGVVLGKLYPRDEPAVAQAAFEKLAKVLPGAVALRAPLPGPSAVYGALVNRLVVLDDVNVLGLGPYDWAPFSVDRGRPGGTLGDWLALPWGGPDEIVLPGYHTAAEDGLRVAGRAGSGSEVFLSVCGLMGSGARTILLSRWRTGGQTSFDLVREFTQELPHTSPADAWQRAVLLTAASRVNLEAEPRIKRSATEEAPKANHPFFWGGYLLVDCGTGPPKDEGSAEEPVVKVKKAEQPQPKPEAKPPEQPEMKPQPEVKPEPPPPKKEPEQKEPELPKVPEGQPPADPKN
jgi:hypothetical protein